MIDRTDWSQAADASRRIGRAVEFHAQIESTNDRARAALRGPDGDGLAVVAGEQTAGRGRRGRTWLSPPGLNLLVSVGLRPRAPMPLARLLGFSAALGVLRACAAAVGTGSLSIRWPNDIVDEAGRKVAGLLVETAVEGERISEAVIGIGINANWPAAGMPPEIRDRAISLADLAGRAVDRLALLRHLLEALDDEVSRLDGGLSPISRLQEHSWLDGHEVEVDLGAGMLRGRVVGIDEDGALRLLEGDRQVALTVGEVVRVLDHPSLATAR